MVGLGSVLIGRRSHQEQNQGLETSRRKRARRSSYYRRSGKARSRGGFRVSLLWSLPAATGNVVMENKKEAGPADRKGSSLALQVWKSRVILAEHPSFWSSEC